MIFVDVFNCHWFLSFYYSTKWCRHVSNLYNMKEEKYEYHHRVYCAILCYVFMFRIYLMATIVDAIYIFKHVWKDHKGSLFVWVTFYIYIATLNFCNIWKLYIYMAAMLKWTDTYLCLTDTVHLCNCSREIIGSTEINRKKESLQTIEVTVLYVMSLGIKNL